MSSGFFYDVAQFVQAVQTWSSRLPEVKPPPSLLETCSKYAQECLHETILPNELLEVECKSRRVNIEQFYRYLIEKTQATPIQFDFARLHLVEYVVSSLCYVGHLCRSENHVRFAKQLEDDTTVISFNWDILLEEALASQRGWHWETGYGLRFKDVVNKGDEAGWNNTSKEESILVLKPHGSVNWFRDSSDSAPGAIDLIVPESDPFLRAGNPPQTMLQYYEQIKDRFERTCISPPGSGQFVHPEVVRLMKERLAQARQIIAIGFSLNEQDQHILTELKGRVYQKDLEVTLVDPRADELEQVYKKAFGDCRVRKQRKTFREYLDNPLPAPTSLSINL